MGGKDLLILPQADVDLPVGRWHEAGNGAVAVHHQAQGRCLYAADREDAIVTAAPAEQGE
ncbi:hypothetical protein D3C77_814770 [compost metagenome]